MAIKWTKQEIDILKKMVGANKTPEDVVKVLKSRSTDGIRNMCTRLNLTWKHEPELDMDAFHKLMKGA